MSGIYTFENVADYSLKMVWWHLLPLQSCLCIGKKKSGMFFKHHLTVTALTDPYSWQTRCLQGGGGRMDGSSGVDRGCKAKMEGDADRGSLKRYNTSRRQRQSSNSIDSTFYTFSLTYTSKCCGRHNKTLTKICWWSYWSNKPLLEKNIVLSFLLGVDCVFYINRCLQSSWGRACGDGNVNLSNQVNFIRIARYHKSQIYHRGLYRLYSNKTFESEKKNFNGGQR